MRTVDEEPRGNRRDDADASAEHSSGRAGGNQGSRGKKNLPVPFPASYWVFAPLLLAGHYPGARAPEEAREKLSALVTAGIRSVVNLMEETEFSHDRTAFVAYDEQLARVAAEHGKRVTVRRMPVRDVSVPSAEFMTKILDWIDAELAAGRPVYVHCRGGVGRTGTVVGCWLVRHGIATGDQALERIARLRRGVSNARIESPETPEQRAMVRSWEPGAQTPQTVGPHEP